MIEPLLGIFGIPGGLEWIAIAAVGLLIFGRRLPDVARSVGKSIVEFKRGLRDVKVDIDANASSNNRAFPVNTNAAPTDDTSGSPIPTDEAKPAETEPANTQGGQSPG